MMIEQLNELPYLFVQMDAKSRIRHSMQARGKTSRLYNAGCLSKIITGVNQ